MNWLDHVAQGALSTRQTLETTYAIAMRACLNNVPGEFVECGVFKGSQCAAMAQAIMKTGIQFGPDGRPVRRVHLFDSFEGVPAPGEHDPEWKEAGHPVGISSASIDEVRQNMAGWKIDDRLLAYHPGWFVRTIPSFARSKTPIAILRLDSDLYESTRICIEQLYPLVSPGGWIIVDDFALSGCRKAVDDFMKGQGGYPPVYFQKHGLVT